LIYQAIIKRFEANANFLTLHIFLWLCAAMPLIKEQTHVNKST
jgi:hypothetical protein